MCADALYAQKPAEPGEYCRWSREGFQWPSCRDKYSTGIAVRRWNPSVGTWQKYDFLSKQLDELFEAEEKTYNYRHPKMVCQGSLKSRCTSDSDGNIIPRWDIFKIVESLTPNAFRKSGCQATDFAKKMITYALKSCDVGHNKAFIRAAFRSALKRFLLSILKIESKVWELFETASVRGAASEKSVSKATQSLVNNLVVLDPIAKLAVWELRPEAAMPVKNSVVVAPSSPPFKVWLFVGREKTEKKFRIRVTPLLIIIYIVQCRKVVDERVL